MLVWMIMEFGNSKPNLDNPDTVLEPDINWKSPNPNSLLGIWGPFLFCMYLCTFRLFFCLCLYMHVCIYTCTSCNIWAWYTYTVTSFSYQLICILHLFIYICLPLYVYIGVNCMWWKIDGAYNLCTILNP